MQAEAGDVLLEVVRDGARSGGGEFALHPQPLAQRISGLNHGNCGGSSSQEIVENSASNASLPKGCDTVKSDENESKSDRLRLDEPAEVSEVHEEGNSPSRGPPKTPKRTKASSPKSSDVSTGKLNFRGKFPGVSLFRVEILSARVLDLKKRHPAHAISVNPLLN